MKAELLVLAATTASACARTRLEAGDSICQRWGEQPVAIATASAASSRGRFAMSIAALISTRLTKALRQQGWLALR